jgi:cytochrome b
MDRMPDTHRVKVWDLPTRLFHWLLVGLVAALCLSGLTGRQGLHLLLGPMVLSLLLFRLAWGIVGSRTSRFSDFVKGPRAALAYLAAARHGAVRSIGHNPLGAYSVLTLLGLLLAQSATGLFASDDIFSQGPLAHLVSSGTVTTLSKLHRLGFKLLLAFVGLHLAAVAFYRFVKHDDLIGAMITGRKSVPAGIDGIRFRNPLLALAVLAACTALVWGTLAAVPPPAAY